LSSKKWKDPRGIKVMTVELVTKEIKEIKEIKETKVGEGAAESREKLVKMGHGVTQVVKVLQDEGKKVELDRLDEQVIPAIRGIKEIAVIKETRGIAGTRVTRGIKEIAETRGIKGIVVIRVIQESEVYLDEMAVPVFVVLMIFIPDAKLKFVSLPRVEIDR
jgi:hypothetical protein